MRGGTLKYKPPETPPDWPDEDGCVTKRVEEVTLQEGTLLDRFGPKRGRFVAVLQKDAEEKPKPASFSSRSLRTLGETPYMYPINGKMRDLRKIIYDMIYTTSNDKTNDEYYVLEVLKEIKGKFPCKAASAYKYLGGALQLGLPDTVENLLKGPDPFLRKLDSKETRELFGGINFPPYISITDGNEAEFRPLSKSLYSLMDLYYSNPDVRKEWRRKEGLPLESPLKPEDLAHIKPMHTVVAPKHRSALDPAYLNAESAATGVAKSLSFASPVKGSTPP
jgi:hypothetical protein